MATTDEVMATAKGSLPKIMNVGKGLMGVGAYIILFLIFVAVMGFVLYFVIRRLKYNHTIIIFEKINGRFTPTRKDKAMEVKFSTAGDTIFYLMRHKKYLPNPVLQTGNRTYWYFIREDGEWINFEPGDFDEDARIMGSHFLDKEMRYARTQVQKGLKERYDRPSFWNKYGTLVISIGFIALIIIGTWLLFDKWIELANATNMGVEKLGNVADSVNRILVSTDNICQGGSGYKPAS